MTATIPSQWPRWIKASCVKQFYTGLQAVHHTHIEGRKRETNGKEKWFEIRIDGPKIRENSDNFFEVDIEINVACVVIGEDHIYEIDVLTGVASSFFTYTIECKRYGDPADDPANDDSFLGCLTLQPGEKEQIDVSNFGKIRHDVEMYQATVEGHYRMFLETS